MEVDHCRRRDLGHRIMLIVQAIFQRSQVFFSINRRFIGFHLYISDILVIFGEISLPQYISWKYRVTTTQHMIYW